MEKRIRALKAIILVVVMIVELFGVDAVRVVAETINVTGGYDDFNGRQS